MTDFELGFLTKLAEHGIFLDDMEKDANAFTRLLYPVLHPMRAMARGRVSKANKIVDSLLSNRNVVGNSAAQRIASGRGVSREMADSVRNALLRSEQVSGAGSGMRKAIDRSIDRRLARANRTYDAHAAKVRKDIRAREADRAINFSDVARAQYADPTGWVTAAHPNWNRGTTDFANYIKNMGPSELKWATQMKKDPNFAKFLIQNGVPPEDVKRLQSVVQYTDAYEKLFPAAASAAPKAAPSGSASGATAPTPAPGPASPAAPQPFSFGRWLRNTFWGPEELTSVERRLKMNPNDAAALKKWKSSEIQRLADQRATNRTMLAGGAVAAPLAYQGLSNKVDSWTRPEPRIPQYQPYGYGMYG